MVMADFESKYVICPFYIRATSNRICCEGVQPKENTINIVFEDSKKKVAYMDRYCMKFNYSNCHICQALNRKYGVNNEIQ